MNERKSKSLICDILLNRIAKVAEFGEVSEAKESAVGIFLCKRMEEQACLRYPAIHHQKHHITT